MLKDSNDAVLRVYIMIQMSWETYVIRRPILIASAFGLGLGLHRVRVVAAGLVAPRRSQFSLDHQHPFANELGSYLFPFNQFN
jgi:hypothetical protein